MEGAAILRLCSINLEANAGVKPLIADRCSAELHTLIGFYG